MARIGSKPIKISEEVSVDLSTDRKVTVKGPKGELSLDMDPAVTVTEENGALVVNRRSDENRDRSIHGLYRSLIGNMIEGVKDGYSKELRVVGIGYRAEVSDNILELALGFSHPVFFMPPEGIEVSVRSERGSDPIIHIEGIDKQLVGQVAAKIRSLRPPEPYKGKGIRYVGEQIKRKAGKTAAR